MSSDKKTIGLTREARKVMDVIMERDYFTDKLDAARFALSLAIKRKEAPGDYEGAETVWNIGSFDPDGEIKDLLNAFYPNNEHPYRLAEYLVNRGLEIISGHFAEDKYYPLEDLLKEK